MNRSRRRCRRLTLFIALVACLGPAFALAATPHAGVAAKDRFVGLLRSGTGALSGASGHVKISLVPGAGTGNIRQVGVTVLGSVCRHGRCRATGGRLHGTLQRLAHQVPDTGQRFQLRLTGKLTVLGRVSAGGTVNGTGFISRGHETLSLTIRAAHGTVSLSAQSPLVPGFTSP